MKLQVVGLGFCTHKKTPEVLTKTLIMPSSPEFELRRKIQDLSALVKKLQAELQRFKGLEVKYDNENVARLELQRKNKNLSAFVKKLQAELQIFKELEVKYDNENVARLELPSVDSSRPNSVFVNEMILMRLNIVWKEVQGLFNEINCTPNFSMKEVIYGYKRLKDHYDHYNIDEAERIRLGLVPQSLELMM